MINIKEAYLSYDNLILFDHINLTIPTGKITCLLGPSGVGKTTLLKMIANIIPENKQTVFKGTITFNQNESSNDISYMGQTDLLFPWLTALENTLIGSRLRGNNEKQVIDKAKHYFKLVNLSHAESKYPHELSGGMRQRIAIIRTLVEDKSVILMDEPFSSLDAITRFELQNLIVKLLQGKTVFLITHDPIEALRIADEIYVMSGLPASISTTLSLKTLKPRNLADKDVIENQELLFEALTEARHL